MLRHLKGCSTPGFPVPYCFSVCSNSCPLISDTIQPSHPRLLPSPPALNLSWTLIVIPVEWSEQRWDIFEVWGNKIDSWWRNVCFISRWFKCLNYLGNFQYKTEAVGAGFVCADVAPGASSPGIRTETPCEVTRASWSRDSWVAPAHSGYSSAGSLLGLSTQPGQLTIQFPWGFLQLL